MKKILSKPSTDGAASRVNISTLVELNDVIVAKFKKHDATIKKNIAINSSGFADKDVEPMLYNQSPLDSIEDERLRETQSCIRMQEEGETYLPRMRTLAIRHDSLAFTTLMGRVCGRIGNVCKDSAKARHANTSLVAKRGGKPFLMLEKNASGSTRGNKA